MRKFISTICLALVISVLSGCSLIPRLTFNTPGTVPQETKKSLRKVKCSGTITLDENGTIQECSRGFYEYEKGYVEKERKFTIMERVGNFIRTLSGFGFWGLVVIAFLFPGLLGGIITFLFSASRRVARETIIAVKRFRRESAPEIKESLDNYLREEQSKETKKYISQVRKSE